jgi:heterodisulfide reductase subunit C
MRLQPRQIKRKMFTCTQCQQCVQACERVNEPNGQVSLLRMVADQCALDVSERDFGRRPEVPASCFQHRPVSEQ